MIQVNEQIQIPESEYAWTFSRAGGPGGQNVNKVSSKAQLRWQLRDSHSLPLEVKLRLIQQHPSRLTVEGEFLVTSQSARDQERNREICIERLVEMIRIATIPPAIRKKLKPSKASKQRRVEEKRRISARKNSRRDPVDE